MQDGQGPRTKCARQPEVSKLQVVVSPVDEQILGLQVPVQHAVCGDGEGRVRYA
jgi:hypothetical protein